MTLAQASDLTPIAGDYEDGALASALSWASSFIIGYCNRSFDYVTDDVVLLTPNRGVVSLPDIPVVTVSSVEGYLPSQTGGMAWKALVNYYVVPDTGLLYDTTGLPGTSWDGDFGWPCLPGSLRVTYTHGYEEVPQGLKDVCVRLAAQWLENPSLTMNSKVGDIEDRYSGSTGVRLNEFDQMILDRYADVGLS